MKQPLFRGAALAAAALALSACGSLNVNLWPFGGAGEQDPNRPPAGATAYQCEGGKRLFVRYLDGGAAAWVMLPEREFRLNKDASGAGMRYTNGSDILEFKGAEATLWDGAKVSHAGCKETAGTAAAG